MLIFKLGIIYIVLMNDLEILAQNCANNSVNGFNKVDVFKSRRYCIKVYGGGFSDRIKFCDLLGKKVLVPVYPVFVEDPNDKVAYYINLDLLLNSKKLPDGFVISNHPPHDDE